MIQEAHRDTVQVCRDGVRKSKAHLELNLTREMKGKKKGFYRYVSNKWKTRENVALQLNGAEDLVTKDTEMPDILNAFLASVFTGPILFNLFVNDLVTETECTLSKFEIKCIITSGDTKLRGVAGRPDGYAAVQRDLNKPEKRAMRIL